jgi:hypothetical protein
VILTAIVVFTALMFSQACTWGLTRKVQYRLPGIGTLPAGTTATNGADDFARRFCATLRHLDPASSQWGACAQWIETTVGEQPPESAEIPKTLGVLVVSGIFAKCFEDEGLFAFDQGVEHLKTAHGLTVDRVSVSGAGSSEANAAQIEEYLRTHPGDYIAVGYSKGVADLMVAIQAKPLARARIKALVSVAGSVGGSRLTDLTSERGLELFKKIITDSGLSDCQVSDAGGLASLRREERYRFLRTWTPPGEFRAFSIVGVVPRKDTSQTLHLLWDRVHYYSLDQDSQVIAEEGIIPGSRFLGVAKGDHWAVALPFEELKASDPKLRRRFRNVDHNRFPRTALLESLVREVYR